MSGLSAQLGWAPLVPLAVLGVAAVLALVLLAVSLARRARGSWLRAGALAMILLALANPRLIVEARKTLPDIAVLLVDESLSQTLGDRKARTEAAVQELGRRLGGLADLEVKTVRFGAPRKGEEDRGTRLFEAMDRALADIPRQRLAGVIALTDGQVHDRPALPAGAPFHVLLSGLHDEGDRRLAVENPPAYGIVGHTVPLRLRIEDTDAQPGETARVTIRRDGQAERSFALPIGQSGGISLPIAHPGPNIFEIATDPGRRELTLENNRAVVVVNGVRDRLKVLLISGEPSPGGRTWRDLLRADPAVDLVHFTILRPPEKSDDTPIEDLSLIAFPVHELFQEKLNSFDLVLFDRYRRHGLLPNMYLANVASYVRRGGAVLVAVGPDFASPFSLYDTPLGSVLPVEPTGQIVERPYRPGLTETGRRHPVTAGFTKDESTWGGWYQMIDGKSRQGEILMTGDGGRPLLVLDRVGNGRVAQLMSDQIWLWARGYEGGGPQAELLRRVAHWLMKEPDLEETALEAHLQGGMLAITRRSLENPAVPVTVTPPDGTVRQVPLKLLSPGRAGAEIEAGQTGIWRITDGTATTVVAVGAANPVEMSEVVTTPAKLAPTVAATGGAIDWLVDGLPDLRRIRPRANAAGHGWLGLVANEDYAVMGVKDIALVPPAAVLLLALGFIGLAWWREGR